MQCSMNMCTPCCQGGGNELDEVFEPVPATVDNSRQFIREEEQEANDQEPLGPGEIEAWYIYDWANSPYFQVMGPLLPILLKWLAEAHAEASGDEAGSDDKARELIIPELGISAGSFPPLVQVLTTIAQVICLLSFSAFGDFGSRRKSLLTALTWVGSALVFCQLLCVSSSLWWLAGLLRISSGCCFCLCTVYYNSYLPMLTTVHPDVLNCKREDRDQKLVEISDEVSGKGMMTGYTGGLALLIVSAVILCTFECEKGAEVENSDVKSECTEFQLFFWPSLCCALVGVWWFVFSGYSLWRLKTRPGPAYPEGVNPVFLGCQQTCKTLATIKQYRQMLILVVAYLIYSDGYSTICSVAPLILENSLEANMQTTVINAILGAVGSLVGVFILLKIQNCTGAQGKTMIIVQLVIFAIVSAAAGFGIIEAIPTFGFYIVMAPCLIMMGSIQSYTRSLYASFIPPGQESAFFAFYAITDKGSNLIGPTVMGFVHNATGKYTGTFLYLLPAFLISAAILSLVDVDKGLADVGKGEAAASSIAKEKEQLIK